MKFSITIPAYKSKFLARAISSILNQQYDNFELIIVDDCSPENIKGVVNTFLDDRIFYYRNEKNCGALNVVDNWNKCLSYCTGEYVICMGDDDMLMPETLASYSNLIRRFPGLAVYHTLSAIIDEDDNIEDVQCSRPIYETVYSFIWHRFAVRKSQFIGDFLFDISILRQVGGFFKLPLAWGSDEISAIRAASINGIANTNKIGFLYRSNSQTISSTSSVNEKNKASLLEKEWILKFLEKEPVDEQDKIYWNLIKKELPRHYKRNINYEITCDLLKHPQKIFYWMRVSGKYEISRGSLLLSCINDIALRIAIHNRKNK